MTYILDTISDNIVFLLNKKVPNKESLSVSEQNSGVSILNETVFNEQVEQTMQSNLLLS